MTEPYHIAMARWFQDEHGCQIVPLWGIETGPSGGTYCRCREGSSCPNEGKHPVKSWKSRPSVLPTVLQNWGFVSDHLVTIDLDSHDVSLPWDLTSHPTMEVTTRKGKHMIYRWDGEPLATRIRFKPDIDIKASGGLVVGAGSARADGGYYESNGLPIAPLPKFVADSLPRPTVFIGVTTPLRERTSPLVWPGVEAKCEEFRTTDTRNTLLFSTMVELYRTRWAGQDAADAIRDAALAAGLTQDEVRRTMESAYKGAYNP